MKTIVCVRCGNTQLDEIETGYICPYCDTRYERKNARTPQVPAPVKTVSAAPVYKPAPKPAGKTGKLFGFRSGTLWKKIVAVLFCYFTGPGYVLMLLSTLLAGASTPFADMLDIQIMGCMFIVMFTIPALLLSDFDCYQRWGFLQSPQRRKTLAILVACIGFVLYMACAMTFPNMTA